MADRETVKGFGGLENEKQQPERNEKKHRGTYNTERTSPRIVPAFPESN